MTKTATKSRQKTGTILLPIAGRSSRFPGMRPKWLLTAPDGKLMIEHALSSAPQWQKHRIIIGLLDEHNRAYDAVKQLKAHFGNHIEFVIFKDVTQGPADTIQQMIKRAKVTGPIFIKDCDSWFLPTAPVFDNIICTADLRQHRNVTDVPAKSFVITNNQGLVVSIVEKNVCSNFFSVGGYGFASAEQFIRWYRQVERDIDAKEIFVSHIILLALTEQESFKAVTVENYVDAGTLPAWRNYRKKYSSYIVNWDSLFEGDKPLQNNIATLQKLQKDGAQIIVIAHAPESQRKQLTSILKKHKLEPHSILLGINQSPLTLIGAFGSEELYPLVSALNLKRGADDLGEYLQ